MLMYLLYKMIRGDFIVFVPMPFRAALAVSLLLRIAEKTVADFTGCMLYRGFYYMGGVYFSFNMASSLVSVPIMTHVYLEHAEVDDGGGEKISADVLWPFGIGIVVLWVGVFVFFLLKVVVPEYRKMFWSTKTGFQRAESQFLDNDEDEKKILVFRKNIVLWSRIKEDVKSWTMSKWETWDREKPEWFTPKVIARIPDEFIPPRFLAKLGGARERRGSAAGSVREAVGSGAAKEGAARSAEAVVNG
jgi:hypothetical protein